MEIERNVAYSRQSRRVYVIGEEYIRDYTAENLQGSKIIMTLLSGNVKNNIYLFFDTE